MGEERSAAKLRKLRLDDPSCTGEELKNGERLYLFGTNFAAVKGFAT
jgi:hypothetical protein